MKESFKFTRRLSALPVLVLTLLSAAPAFAVLTDADAVAQNLEAFRAAQFAADAQALGTLCAEELSYSHADGRIQDKAAFIAGTVNRKVKLLKLSYDDPKIRIVGNAAIVRFYYISTTEAEDGTQSSNKLLILMNWQKQGADWKLLSRASTKL